MRTYYDSEITFMARGNTVWRIGDVEGEDPVAECVNRDWALEIAKTLRGEGVHCRSCDGHACDDEEQED